MTTMGTGKCIQCGKEFVCALRLINIGKRKYCSTACSNTATKKGKERPSVQKEKNVQWDSSIPTRNCLTCGHSFRPTKRQVTNGAGYFCSNECWRISHQVYDQTRRESMHNGKYKNWRISVFERDNYICQKCLNPRKKNLNAHHIFPWAKFPSLRYEISNGITMCKDCHIAWHKHMRQDYFWQKIIYITLSEKR